MLLLNLSLSSFLSVGYTLGGTEGMGFNPLRRYQTLSDCSHRHVESGPARQGTAKHLVVHERLRSPPLAPAPKNNHNYQYKPLDRCHFQGCVCGQHCDAFFYHENEMALHYTDQPGQVEVQIAYLHKRCFLGLWAFSAYTRATLLQNPPVLGFGGFCLVLSCLVSPSRCYVQGYGAATWWNFLRFHFLCLVSVSLWLVPRVQMRSHSCSSASRRDLSLQIQKAKSKIFPNALFCCVCRAGGERRSPGARSLFSWL